MEAQEKQLKNKPNIILESLKSCLSSRVFPFVTAAVMLLCYYLGLDMVAIYFIAVSGILMVLLLKDLTPFLTPLLFMNVVVSMKNSPSPIAMGSKFYFRPVNLAFMIGIAAILVGVMFYKIIKTAREGRFTLEPTFFGLCALAVAFILNGMFSAGYTAATFFYGIAQALVYMTIFCLLKDNITVNKETFKNVAIIFMAFTVLLLIELTVAHLTTKDLYVDGVLDRSRLSFGWGVYNTMGMLLLLSIPSAIYLATVCKRGYLFTIYALVLMLACLLSYSRQAMLGMIVIVPLSLFYLFRYGKYRKENLIIIAVVAVAAIGVVAVFWEKIFNVLKTIFENIFVNGHIDGAGRIMYYDRGITAFFNAPVFGSGFFDFSPSGPTESITGLSIRPVLYHNTFIQMLGSCGIIGMALYAVHRVQTVFSLFDNFTDVRFYMALSISVILLLSLVDIHMFDILPTFTYGALLALFTAADKKKPAKPQKQLFIVK